SPYYVGLFYYNSPIIKQTLVYPYSSAKINVSNLAQAMVSFYCIYQNKYIPVGFDPQNIMTPGSTYTPSADEIAVATSVCLTGLQTRNFTFNNASSHTVTVTYANSDGLLTSTLVYPGTRQTITSAYVPFYSTKYTMYAWYFCAPKLRYYEVLAWQGFSTQTITDQDFNEVLSLCTSTT
ncbi:MAG: hypothetical protein QW320_12280, partial [Ignisphaera sp.]